MDHGQIVAEGTPDDLKREVAGDVVTIGVAGSGRADRENGPLAKVTEVLGEQSYVRQATLAEDGTIRLYVDAGATALPQIIRQLDGTGVLIDTLELHRPSLDDVFLTQTGRSLREQ
jgi:ABC-2 type transport system ATP-binding protein